MQLGWLGSRLLPGGVAILAAGYALMILALPLGNVVAGVGVAAIAGGAAALCISPRPPFSGKVATFGLGLLAVGTASLVIAAIIAAGMEFDPLESMPVVILGFAGLSLTPIGLIVTAIALIRRFLSRS